MKQLTILFLVRNDEVLLAMKKRGFGKDRWNGVGGKVEPNETIEQAMQRECREEIHVNVTKFTKQAVIVFDEAHLGVRDLLQVHVFIGTAWEGEPEETEEMAPRWFTRDSIPYKEMWADDTYWLPQVLAGKKVRASFTMDDQDQVIEHDVKEVKAWDD